MKKDKKGISAIVATVLIILITVAAVTIIWAAIIPMISNQLAGSTECFDASAALSIVSDCSCVNQSKNAADANYTAKIQVHRATGDFDLAGVDIQLAVGGTTESFSMGSTNLPDVNGDKVYAISYDAVALGGNATEVSVAAVVTTGSTTETCGASGMATLRACA